ncbi:hypothetical protein WBG78_28470 [Chryseolinea sp. T2]|uniref:hypothetical protein n=1 Tax=Chryseolinea sp. T2 TaxID=3129255 RepID=UPI003077A838
MAILQTGGTVYTASYPGVVARFMKEADLISKGHVYVQGGFNESFKIPRVSMSDAIQAHTETPASEKGDVTFDNATLTLTKYDVFVKFNPNSLAGYWKPFQADGEFNFKTLPGQVQGQITSVLLNQVAGYNDIVLLQGDTSLTGTTNLKYVTGFIKRAQNAPEVYDITGATTITQANVISELQRAIRQSKRNKSDVRRATYDPNFKLFVSQYTKDLYGDALRGLTNKSISIEDRTPDRVNGLQLVALPGMPDNAILGAVGQNSPSSNLWVGCNDMGDFTSVRIERWRPESELYFMKMTIGLDSAIVKPEEVFLYKA